MTAHDDINRDQGTRLAPRPNGSIKITKSNFTLRLVVSPYNRMCRCDAASLAPSFGALEKESWQDLSFGLQCAPNLNVNNRAGRIGRSFTKLDPPPTLLKFPQDVFERRLVITANTSGSFPGFVERRC